MSIILTVPLQIQLEDALCTPIYLRWWEQLLNTPLDEREAHWESQPWASPMMHDPDSPSRISLVHDGQMLKHSSEYTSWKGGDTFQFRYHLDGAALNQIREAIIAGMTDVDHVQRQEVEISRLSPNARLVDCLLTGSGHHMEQLILEETFLELEDCTVDYLCTSVMSSDQDLDGLQVLGYHEERDAGAFYGITEPTLEPNAPVVRGDRYHTTACSHLLEKRSDMDPTANPCHATLLTAGSDTYVWQEDRWTPLTEQIPEIEGLYVQPNLIPFLPAVPPRVLVVPRQRSRDGDPRLTEYLSYYGPPLYLPGACLYYRKSTAKSARG